jgi:hypothetical protein
MFATPQPANCSNARRRSFGLMLAGGILYVLGFGGPSLLLSMGHGHAGSGFVGPA